MKDNFEILKNERMRYIDIARGIAIILMIAGHVFYFGIIKKIIFSFHIPLFIIISGMFFYKNNNFKKLMKEILKLFIFYIITVLIVDFIKIKFNGENINIIKQLILSYSNGKTFFTDTKTVGVLWFIPYLIVIKCLFFLITKISKENEKINCIICVIFTIIGLIFSKMKLYLPWSFDISLATILIFYFGYVIKKYELLEKILHSKKILILSLFIWIIGIIFTKMELVWRTYSFMSFFVAICGSMIIFKISLIIDHITKLFSKILSWYGKNSIWILIFHYIEASLINYNYSNIINFLLKLIMITMLTLFTVLIKDFFIVYKKINNIKENKTYE